MLYQNTLDTYVVILIVYFNDSVAAKELATVLVIVFRHGIQQKDIPLYPSKTACGPIVLINICIIFVVGHC